MNIIRLYSSSCKETERTREQENNIFLGTTETTVILAAGTRNYFFRRNQTQKGILVDIRKIKKPES
ncbi:MAG TPA: hypothetical protein DCP92_17750 [Nitrospiraceae bacterium]|jgi:hypothetical protein|nr:hypothetical protein [Nitrospiraceae bacterium]